MPESTSTTTHGTPGHGAVSDWASEVAGPAAPAVAPAQPADRGFLVALGAAMVASPLAMAGWFAVEPSVLPREDPQVFLESVATSPDRYLAGTALLALAAVLAIPAAVGFARLLRPRLPRLGVVIAVLMFLSGVGLCAQVGFRAMVWSMVDAGSVPASSVETYTAFQTGGFFDVLVAPGLVFGGVATLLVVGSLLWTRLVSRWVPVAMIVGMVLSSGEFADAVTVSGAALGVLANLWLARTLVARG
ncbi:MULTISPECIES: DUF4386 family protein [unclassified Nocardioides]|uniref:DUF4386 family protein n=1 Tax=unclassified Nocardioides TaxID=2615069 RepID=UPI0036060FC1